MKVDDDDYGGDWDLGEAVQEEDESLNLHQILMDKLKVANKKNILNRIVMISKVLGPPPSVREMLQKILKTVSTEDITGFLLVYRTHCIHIIEATSEDLTSVVRFVDEHEQSEEPILAQSKILVISHDIAARCYQHGWSCRIMDLETAMTEDYEATESMSKVVEDVLIQLLKLSAYISKIPKPSLKTTMDTLPENVPHCLPAQEIILYLLNTDDNCVSTLREYLDMYDKPLQITLDSDLSWPMDHKLFPLK